MCPVSGETHPNGKCRQVNHTIKELFRCGSDREAKKSTEVAPRAGVSSSNPDYYHGELNNILQPHSWDVHILIPGTYEYVTSHGTRDLAGVFVLRVLRRFCIKDFEKKRDYPVLST